MRYWAFISYSHRDRRWAEWLHGALETYRVPRHLVGTSRRGEPTPARLFPVFRDRDELAGASDLSEQITAALADSRFLIVLCSPGAAASRWVNQEVEEFKRLGRGDRILCLIVDGEPHAADPSRECFPPALRAAPGAPPRSHAEPLAADVREGRDRRRPARLKIIAGILGVGYDTLQQRDRQRRNRRRIQLAAAGVLLAGALAASWGWQEREKARIAREELIGRYVDEGRQELLAERPQRAAALLTEAYRLGGTHVALRQLLAMAYQPADAEPVALLGHTGEVTSVDFSPDGRWIATGSWDGTARVWDARTGANVAVIDAHRRTVGVARFGADGSLLTAGWDGTARLWEAGSWKPVATFGPVADRVVAAALSADGRSVVTAGFDNRARVWDARTGALRSTLIGHEDAIVAASFDPRGARVLTASLDGTARVWDAASGRVLGVLSAHADRLTCAQISPKGDRIATAGFDKTVRLWDAESLRLVATLTGHTLPVVALAFSPDGRQIASAGWDKTARLWDAASGRAIATLEGHTQAVVSVAFDPAGERLATSSWDKSVKVWDVQSDKLLASLEGHSGIARAVAFGPQGARLASASFDGTAKVWNVALERRGAEALAAIADCRIPWRVEAGRLVARSLDPAACGRRNSK